jgi:signal transduction histidine kinase
MSLVAGRSLSRLILRPIRALIGTMEDIEKSAKPQHIDPPQSRDELNQLALTFNAMITKLQASIDLQKQFVSDASHELRTPLTVIASFTEILRKRGVDNPALTQEALEAIASESSRMEQMTTQLLALARSESPVLAELESVDFVDCSRKVVANLQQATGRDIHLDAPAAPVHIRASQASVIQLLLILLDNAIKYSQLPIAVRVARVDKQLVLTVRDEGVGIPAADLPFIFDRFYRVDKARSRATGGTGLGLAIAKNIVTTYNGTIQITSENEKWTCVEVRFATID